MRRLNVLALVPGESATGLQAAAAEAGGGVEVVGSVGALLGRLADATWTATVVSLGAEHVDDAVIERIAAEAATGLLFIATPGASLEAALLAERLGAAGVLHEPVQASDFSSHLVEAVGEGAAVPLPSLNEGAEDGAPRLVGASRAMAKVFGMIAKVARSTSTVLITGESGTGKEVVARTLHAEGDRRDQPFVAVNCAAIPEHLLESELFGHEKGAFTGAVGRRTGRFERANGGTLFLDEIGDMSLILQAKILRVLEERVIEPVGSEATRAVDVRLIAATHRDLGTAIVDGRFREDLYYRLAVVEIDLPALRERGPDVRALALHFAAHFASLHLRPIHAITEAALSKLEAAVWTGNVRELRNVLDRAVLLTTGDTIGESALRLGTGAPHGSAAALGGGRGSGPDSAGAFPEGYSATVSLAQVEADHIRRVLQSVGGQIGKAATVLGIHRNTLARKLQEHDIGVEPAEGQKP
jgi:DNA-binding NtrC family response regulator